MALERAIFCCFRFSLVRVSPIDEMEETGVPVESEQQVVDERDEAQQVGVVGVALAAVEERPQLVDLHQAEDTQNRLEAQREVQEVEGKQAQAVHVERRRVHVVLPQLYRVRLKNSILSRRNTYFNLFCSLPHLTFLMH